MVYNEYVRSEQNRNSDRSVVAYALTYRDGDDVDASSRRDSRSSWEGSMEIDKDLGYEHSPNDLSIHSFRRPSRRNPHPLYLYAAEREDNNQTCRDRDLQLFNRGPDTRGTYSLPPRDFDVRTLSLISSLRSLEDDREPPPYDRVVAPTAYKAPGPVPRRFDRAANDHRTGIRGRADDKSGSDQSASSSFADKKLDKFEFLNVELLCDEQVQIWDLEVFEEEIRYYGVKLGWPASDLKWLIGTTKRNETTRRSAHKEHSEHRGSTDHRELSDHRRQRRQHKHRGQREHERQHEYLKRIGCKHIYQPVSEDYRMGTKGSKRPYTSSTRSSDSEYSSLCSGRIDEAVAEVLEYDEDTALDQDNYWKQACTKLRESNRYMDAWYVALRKHGISDSQFVQNETSIRKYGYGRRWRPSKVTRYIRNTNKARDLKLEEFNDDTFNEDESETEEVTYGGKARRLASKLVSKVRSKAEKHRR